MNLFSCPDKKIKDSVHGYISIPVVLFKNFIDTPHFQRLRRIEQTSMRSLYPSARHDRFIHSLGTFHLGQIAIKHLKESDDGHILSDSLCRTFLIACLLHDCGHAPFSHTFEDYFGRPDNFRNLFRKIVPNEEEFLQDLEDLVKAKPHEYLSALIVIRIYSGHIRSLGADPLLAARMIVGAKFAENKPENALIELLNGRAIDVDKLDYVVRDIYLSGIKHAQVDIDRLLSSILIKQDKSAYRICFRKTALSTINSVVEVKNFLDQWVFSHHIVQYEQYMLKKSVAELACYLYPGKNDDEALAKLFNPNTYLDMEDLPKADYPMLCDDDLVFLVKNNNLPHAREWLFRQYQMKPLWKSYYEFKRLFTKNLPCGMRRIRRCLDEILNGSQNYLIIEQTEQQRVIEYHSLFILMADHDICAYEELFDTISKTPNKFFYLFIKSTVPPELKADVLKKLHELLV